MYVRSIFVNVQNAGVLTASAALAIASSSLQASKLENGSMMTVRRKVIDTVGTGNGTANVNSIMDAAYRRQSGNWQYLGQTFIGHIT